MSKVRVHITVSADGFVAGPNQSEENPLGEGGGNLHEWALRPEGLPRAPRYGGRRGEREHPIVEEALALGVRRPGVIVCAGSNHEAG